jgi:uncharacterized protein
MDKAGDRFVWYELTAADMEGAKAFYTRVLGWGAADVSAPGHPYVLFTAGGTPVAGMMPLNPDVARAGAGAGAEPQWIGYVAVDDVDEAAARVEKLGGVVHVPPTDVPGISRFSIIADPQRATLALVKARESANPRQEQPDAPGHVAWHELHTTSPDDAVSFYYPLFGWRKSSIQTVPEGGSQEFSAGGASIGGMLKAPENATSALWLYYFNVHGIAAAVKRVEAAGGQVLDGPWIAGGALIAHCRDLQGAMFALIDNRVQVTIGCYQSRGPSGGPPGSAP